jgi:transcriptional regulator
LRARLLADVGLNRRIVTGLKRIDSEIDFEIASAAALDGLPDHQVLLTAADKDRILVSHDRRTMPAAFYEFIRRRESPGLIW